MAQKGNIQHQPLFGSQFNHSEPLKPLAMMLDTFSMELEHIKVESITVIQI
jgi:hypothetical protein